MIDCVHKTPPAAESGYAYVAIPQIRDGRIDLSSARRITSADYTEWTKKAEPSPNDVVLSRRCNPGETAFVAPGSQFALGQNLVLLRADGTRIYPPFLRWLVRGPAWWVEVARFINVGAVFDSLKCAEIPDFTLPIPPLAEQRRLAHILGTLDDKIELNRKMSETLEAMARALFKSWFVDFDPVRAKMEGRWRRGQSLPGLPANLYDLFPDSLVDSELGEVPEGWRVESIGALAEVVGGGTPSTKEPAYWNGPYWWATPKDLSTLTVPVLLRTERRITEAGLAKISSGLLPPGTVLLSSRAPIGYLAIAQVPVAMNQGFIALKPRPGVPNLFLLRWAEAAMSEIIRHANGSTFLEVSKSRFRPIRVLLPPRPILDVFHRVSRGLYSRLVVNERASVALGELRDTLLPKLVSGELSLDQGLQPGSPNDHYGTRTT